MNLALIGLGMVAGTHFKAVSAIGAPVRLAGIMSRDPVRAKEFLSQQGLGDDDGIKIFTTVYDISEDPDIDVVLVCTPPNARVEIVRTLASAGKHILIEKPIERSVEAAREIIEICEAHSVYLGVFLQHRMRSSAQRARQVLASGILGEIALVEITVPWWREQSYYDEPGRGTYARDGGGVLMSQAIHTLDLALDLIGPVTTVQAMARTTRLHSMETEDFVSAGLEFGCGAVGCLVASTASYPGGNEGIIVHGTKGSANLTSGRMELNFHDGTREDYGEDVGTGGSADPMAFTHEWHQAVVEDFLSAIREGSQPAISGREALRVQVLIEALIESSDQGRRLAVPPMEPLWASL